MVASMVLYSGKELSQGQYEELLEQNSAASAKSRAVRMLSASNLSEKELRRRMLQKGESPEHTQDAVDWLSDLNLIDDSQVGKQAVRVALSKGYGKARIKQILYEKGIEKSLWDELLEDLPDMDEAVDAFLKKRLRGSCPDQKEIKRTVDALVRRGHNWSDIQAGLRRYTDGLDEIMED